MTWFCKFKMSRWVTFSPYRFYLSLFEQDDLRVAYSHRHSIVLDSTAPHLAPHIVITPPEKNIQDYYTPWFNAPGSQWPGHLMVTMPPNAMDHTLARVPLVRPPRPGKYAPPRTVFCLSKFKTFVSQTTRTGCHILLIGRNK